MESALERKEEEASRNKTRQIPGLEIGLGCRVFSFVWYSTTENSEKQAVDERFFLYLAQYSKIIY